MQARGKPYLVRMGRRGKRVLAEEVEVAEVHHEGFVMNLKATEKTVLLSCKCYVCIVVNFSKTPPTDELCSKSPTIVSTLQFSGAPVSVGQLRTAGLPLPEAMMLFFNRLFFFFFLNCELQTITASYLTTPLVQSRHFITHKPKSRHDCATVDTAMLASTLASLYNFCYIALTLVDGVKCPLLHTHFFGPF